MLAYLDCFSGISGDMLLGAMVDAGLDLAALRTQLAALPLAGYTLMAERVTSHGITGTRVTVRLEETAPHAHRGLREIFALIDAAAYPEPLAQRMRAIFARLAEAEAAVHGVAPEAVTFHEVGAVDSIVDTVGAVLGLDLLGVDADALYCSELPLTSGRVRSAHGPLPVPAPATLALLRGTDAVWRPVAGEGELVTPTGAAVLVALARFERPAVRVRQIGYGFGTRELPWANCLRFVLGEPVPVPTERVPSPDWTSAPASASGTVDILDAAATRGFERDEIVMIESNIDTMTGEALGWLMERLMAAGALDVSYASVQMKKNRPGTLLRVLSRPGDAAALAAAIVRDGETLGVRVLRAERLKAERHIETIETPLGTARVKLKRIGGHLAGLSVEYDDCRALAAARGLPLGQVREVVLRAAYDRFGMPAQPREDAPQRRRPPAGKRQGADER